MPLILRIPKPLPLKNMTQMPTAIITHNLRPHHAETAIGFLAYGPRHGVPEGGPSATRVEFVVRFVERCGTACAGVDSG